VNISWCCYLFFTLFILFIPWMVCGFSMHSVYRLGLYCCCCLWLIWAVGCHWYLLHEYKFHWCEVWIWVLIHNNWRPPWGKGRSSSSVHHGYQRLHLGGGNKHGSMEVYGSIEGWNNDVGQPSTINEGKVWGEEVMMVMSWRWCVCSQLSSSTWRGGVKNTRDQPLRWSCKVKT
jgi:hypothetical protein